jgi:predicted RNA-binding protein YlqC (UPF0109 family)
MSTTIDQQFVEFVVKSLVGNPDAVKIERSIDEKGVLLELTVAAEDLGRVIGKRGNTAQSIRTLLRALGTKNDARYNLKIVDVGGEGARPKPARADESQDEAPAAADAATDDGAGQWSHLATPASEEPETDEEPADDDAPKSSTESSSVVEKTRKELEDLADLNI